MAAVSDLNIRLGLVTKGFDKALAQAERQMRGAVARMGQVGTELSVALSAPLGIIGAAALKTAAQFESLQLAMTTTFESVGRGSGEAAAELEKLRVAALAPGLDFEQAVKGSVRLQGVGISAEKARLILQELGNTLASTGGSADQLDAVTKQFTQIIGKGRILQEDLSIILENMPGLARVLKDEFGTTSAEAIRALGVSAEDFINRITDRMATMPRVAGGLTNAFTNAGVAIRQSLATVGEAINKTFNVTGLLNSFSEWIVGLADAFASLDGGTQAVVLSVGAFVFALGPAIKLVSTLQGVWITMAAGAARLVTAFQAASAAGTGLTGVLTGMNAAARLNVFIAAASIVLALGAAIVTYSARVGEATESQRLFAAAQQRVAEEAGRETAALNKNFEVLKSTTASTDERRMAIAELQKLYPDYLRGVNLESASLTRLTEIQSELNQQILRGVAERQKAAAVEDQFAKAAQAQLRIQQLREKGFAALSGEEVKRSGRSLFGTDFEKQFVQASAQGEVVRDVIKALEQDVKSATTTAKELSNSFDNAFGIGTKAANRQYDALTNQRQALEDAKDALEDMTPGQREALKFSQQWDERWKANKASASGALKETKAQTDAYKNALASIRAVAEKGDVLGADLFGEQANEIQNQIERLIEAGFKPYGAEVQHLRSMLVDMRNSLGSGLVQPNAAQTALAELDKIDAAIRAVNEAVEPIQLPIPFVDPAVAELQRVQDALRAAGGLQVQPLVFPVPVTDPALDAVREFDTAVRGALGDLAPAEIPVPLTEAAYAEMERLKKSVQEAGTPPERIEVPPPVVDGALAEINRVTAALAKIVAPAPLVLAATAAPLGEIPTLPSLTLPSMVVSVETSEAQAALEALQSTATAAIETNGLYAGTWTQIADIMVLASEGLNGFSSALAAAGEMAMAQGDVLGGIALAVGDSVAQAAGQGAASFGELANAAVSAGAKIVRAWIQQGVAAAVAKALGGLPFPFNLAAGAVAGAAAAALFTKAISAIGVPALAEGGVAKKPTLALIGEYAGASTNPEIVAPEKKLREIFQQESGGGGVLTAQVRGDDLLFILESAARRKGRTS